MHRVLFALVAALVVAGVAGEVRRLTWSNADLQAHAGRAADALAARRKSEDRLMRPNEPEKALRSAATTPQGLQMLRKRLSERVLASFGVLAMLAVIAIFLWLRHRIAHAACVVTCTLVTAGAMAALVPAVRAYELVGDKVVRWELAELLLLGGLGLATVVVAMLDRTRAEFRPDESPTIHLKA
jgi:hypothetical protein